MSDSFSGHKFRVAALSAQAEQAIDVERACRNRLGERTRSAISHTKVIAIASVAGLALTLFLRRRRKRKRDDDRHDDARDTSEHPGMLAKAGMAVLLAQRIFNLAGPFMRGMNWMSARDERVTERSQEAAYTGE